MRELRVSEPEGFSFRFAGLPRGLKMLNVTLFNKTGWFRFVGKFLKI